MSWKIGLGGSPAKTVAARPTKPAAVVSALPSLRSQVDRRSGGRRSMTACSSVFGKTDGSGVGEPVGSSGDGETKATEADPDGDGDAPPDAPPTMPDAQASPATATSPRPRTAAPTRSGVRRRGAAGRMGRALTAPPPSAWRRSSMKAVQVG
jgi:hypothetical protein